MYTEAWWGAAGGIGKVPLFFRVAVAILFWTTLLAAALLVPAGTFDWWRAWVLIGAMGALTLGATSALFRSHKDLIEERIRLPIQRGQPAADKIIIALVVPMFYGLLVFTALDVFRLHLLGAPSAVVSLFGLALFFAGWRIAYLAARENSFASAAVKHTERQAVVDTGVYGIVRHPMYAGAIPLLIGIPLWLQSYAGAVAALVPIGLFVVRILVEERFLAQALDGYEAYTRRVRYRLVPLLW